MIGSYPDSNDIAENQLTVEQIEDESKDNSVVKFMHEKMEQLNIFHGDYVLLKSKKQRNTVCIAIADQRCPIESIKMSLDVRMNLRVMLGDMVSVFPLHHIDYGKSIRVLPIDDTIRGKTCDLFSDYLQPYFGGNTTPYRPLHEGDIFKVQGRQGIVEFRVTATEPKPFCIVGPETIIYFNGTPIKREHINKEIKFTGYESVGGYKKELLAITEAVDLWFKYPFDMNNTGMQPPRRILLHGPPGTGKSLIANATAIECGAFFLRLDKQEITKEIYGNPENCLTTIFSIAKRYAPSIIFFDDLDYIASNESKITESPLPELITFLENINENSKVIVIAATNSLNNVHHELRGFGRFDREIFIGVPNTNDRTDILRIHTRRLNLAKNVNIEQLARETHGFVGSDLASLCTEAIIKHIREKIHLGDSINNETMNSLLLTMEDFRSVLATMSPKFPRENITEISNVSWEDICGLENVKKRLHEIFNLPIKFKANFLKYGLSAVRGILLFGPPGCGKTLLGSAIASMYGENFMYISGTELLCKCASDLKANLTDYFKNGRRDEPYVIFIDELESIVRELSDDTLISILLTEIDSINPKNVTILAATNQLDLIDNSILRSGRINELIYIPLPDRECRKSILENTLKKFSYICNFDLDKIVENTEGFSGANLFLLCKKACILALKEEMETDVNENCQNPIIKIQMNHFNKALEEIKPHVSDEEIQKYLEFLKRKNI